MTSTIVRVAQTIVEAASTIVWVIRTIIEMKSTIVEMTQTVEQMDRRPHRAVFIGMAMGDFIRTGFGEAECAVLSLVNQRRLAGRVVLPLAT